jgi:membrane-bound serine protease (ClpP class)
MTVLAQAGQTAPATQGGDGGALLVWAVILLGIGVALFLIELFVPSGGILSVASSAAVIAGIALMFWRDTTLGLVTLIVVLVALPFAIGLAIAIWPNTWVARYLTLGGIQQPLTKSAADSMGVAPAASDAVAAGQRGRAVTDLRPIGTCLIDGQRRECLASGGLITAGTDVVVVSVDGMHVKVRQA